MKKLLVIISSIALIGLVSSQANAQVRFGGGLAFGEGVEELGITANALIGLSEKVDIQPSFTYYFTPSIISYWELNADVHYSITSSDAVDLYAIGGINYSRFGFELDIFGIPVDASASEVGANLGLGANFSKGNSITPFGEIKYVVSDLDQLVITAGVRF